MVVCEDAYTVCVSGSYAAPGQFVPPAGDGRMSVASGPPALLSTGGVYIGPSLYCDTSFTASARRAGVKSIRSSIDTPWRSYAGGLVGNGCVGAYHSPGTSPLGTGRSSIGHTGSPVRRSSTYVNACLLTCITAFTRRPLTVMSPKTG